MSHREDHEFVQRVAQPLRQAELVEPGFESRLFTSIRAAAERGEAPWTRGGRRRHLLRRSLGWLVVRRHVAVSPVAGLAMAAGFAALVAATTLAATRTRSTGSPAIVVDSGRQVVHFAIVAPTATVVTLAGDFNAWDTKATPLSKGAIEGLWLVSVPLRAGTYQYAFVVDGITWLADPAAPLAIEDEFGTPSSILTIRGSRT